MAVSHQCFHYAIKRFFAFSLLSHTVEAEAFSFSLSLAFWHDFELNRRIRERVVWECVRVKLWSSSRSWNGKIPNSSRKNCVLTKLTSQLSTEPASRRSRKTWSVCNNSEWKLYIYIHYIYKQPFKHSLKRRKFSSYEQSSTGSSAKKFSSFIQWISEQALLSPIKRNFSSDCELNWKFNTWISPIWRSA